jgi:hypothetical protein
MSMTTNGGLMPDLDRNKAAATGFYDLMFNQNRPSAHSENANSMF